MGTLLLPAAVGLFSTWIKLSVQFPAQPTQTCALTREVAQTGQANLCTWITCWQHTSQHEKFGQNDIHQYTVYQYISNSSNGTSPSHWSFLITFISYSKKKKIYSKDESLKHLLQNISSSTRYASLFHHVHGEKI